MSTTIASFPPGYLTEYQGATPVALSIAFIVLEVFFVSVRYWARHVGHVKWGADDILMIPATMLCLTLCGFCIAFVKAGGAGYHEPAVKMNNPQQLVFFSKLQFIIPVLYFASAVFPKFAILAIYLRILNKKVYRVSVWIIATILVANWLGVTIAACFMCQPLRFLWDRTIPGGHCFNITNFFRWSSIVNILTDIAMLILPLPAVWKIHTSRNIKIGLTITFATGSVGLITSILRFVGFFSENAVADATWAAAPLIIWTDIETGTYLIAACLPTYRPLAILLLERKPLSYLSSRSKTTQDSSNLPRTRGSEIPLERKRKEGFSRFEDIDEDSKSLA